MRRREFVRWNSAALVAAATHPLYALDAKARTRPRARPPVGHADRSPPEIRLYANENPYGPPPRAVSAMAEVLPYANRYGRYGTDGHLIEPGDLEALIAEREGVDPDQVLVSHGATELLQLCASAFAHDGIAVQLPTYGPILGYANALDRSLRISRLGEDDHYHFSRLRASVDQGATCLYLCHPNNPTGLIEPQDQLEEFCRDVSRDAVVVADEAYHEFVEADGYRSLVALVREGLDVVVLRTFSKAYGMAGIRVGYAMGPAADRIGRLRGLQVGPINVVSLVGARAGLQSSAFVRESRAKLAATRRRFVEGLRGLDVSWRDSVTNFMLIDVGRPTSTVMADLRSQGIRVNSAMERESTRLRVTIGTDEEIDALLEGLHTILG